MKNQRTGRIGKKRHPQLLAMIECGCTAGQIADVLCVNPETVRKFARNRGLTITPEPMTMANHPSWSGGTTTDRSGYLLQRVSADSPHGYLIRAIGRRGDSHGYAPVHRIVMHDQLGRRLRTGEVVDHIDGDKANNHPSNLRVFASNAEHLRKTLKGRCPNWTPAGRARITGRPLKIQPLKIQHEPIVIQTRTDDTASL